MSKDIRGTLFAKRLISAAEKKDPFSYAIICYQSIRESPLFNKWKDIVDKSKREELVKSSIVENSIMLRDIMLWKEEKINKFVKYMVEFAKEM